MAVTVAVYDAVTDYAARVRPVLRAEEALNCLPLGILWQLEHGDVYETWQLATVERDGDILGVFLRTPPWPWNVTAASSAELDVVADAVVDHLVLTDAEPAGVNGSAPLAEAVARRWAAAVEATAELEMAMRVMACDLVAMPARPDGARRPAGPGDLQILHDWMSDFQLEVFRETVRDPQLLEERLRSSLAEPDHGLWFWEDARGDVVSLAGIGRPTGRGERVGPVYTPRPYRGRGYAGRLVAEVTAAGLDRGLEQVFLFTDAANPVSNALYERIGYRQVGEAATWSLA